MEPTSSDKLMLAWYDLASDEIDETGNRDLVLSYMTCMYTNMT